MKRAYLTNGTLVAGANPKDATFQLDAATWAYLNGLLGTDYCYLIVNRKEVVKVLGLEAPNYALVSRGLENTCREPLAVNSPIQYRLTQSEINDAVTYIGVMLTAEYPLEESNGQINYTEMQIVGIGGCTVDGSDEGIWMIQNIPANTGCCPLAPQEPPPIPLNYFDLRVVTEGYYRATTQGDYRAYE